MKQFTHLLILALIPIALNAKDISASDNEHKEPTQQIATTHKTNGSHVWKVTYSVMDAEKSAKFCVEVLGLIRVPIPDETLAKGRAWVKFPDSDLQLHFVEAQPWRYGYKEISDAYKTIDKLDHDMSRFTTFMDNHAAIWVDDLDLYLTRLHQFKVPFLGPIRRDDGVYQLYFEIPGHLYIEFDSNKPPSIEKALTWKDVDFGQSKMH